MHTTTLQGVFPEPKPAYRRNFIKENVKSIKQMQGLLQEAGLIQPRHPKDDKFRNVPVFPTSKVSVRTPSIEGKFKTEKKPSVKPKFDRMNKEKSEVVEKEDQKFTHRAMQTERTDNLTKLYETGVIKYPRPGVAKTTRNVGRGSPIKPKGQGDQLEEGMQNLDLEEKDFVKENMTNFRHKTVRQPSQKMSSQLPATYQRGVIPKYLRDRREEDIKESEEEPCPAGHVLLPEEERKETLKVLRQSYADRIQELNTLPVRSDTLRVRKRKTEIEEELKRIDGGIKVFQRPKVYVKINA